MDKAIKLLLLVVGVGLVIVSGYLGILRLSLIAREEPAGFILLLIILSAAGLLIYAGLRKEKPQLKPQPAAQTKPMLTKDVDIQTNTGCIIDFVLFIALFIIAVGPNPQGAAAILVFIGWIGCILFAIIWPIRGRVMKNKLQQQAKQHVTSPALSAFMLSRVPGNTTTIDIPLPEDDALVFVSEPSNNYFNVIMPQGVRNRVYRLIEPQLELYIQAGWELDTFEPTPREIIYKPYEEPSKGIPFTKRRYRCTKVLVHLRRRT